MAEIDLPDKKTDTIAYNPVEQKTPVLSLPDGKSDNSAVGALANSYRRVVTENPDAAARVLRLSHQTGEHPAFVTENVEQIEKAVNAPSDEYWLALYDENPRLAEFLKSEHNMVIAHDDLENLKLLERIVTEYRRGIQSGSSNVRQAELGWMQLIETLSTGKRSEFGEEELIRLEQEQNQMQQPKGMHPVFFASQQLPNYGLIGRKAIQRAFQGGLVGAGMAIIAGQVATVSGAAVAGAKIGVRVGAAEAAAILEGGLAYREFVGLKDKNGQPVDPRLAAGVALAVGVVNSGLEYASLAALLRTIPGGRAILESLGRNQQIFAGMTGKRAIMDAARRYLTAIGTEVGTEVLQEATAAGGRQAIAAATGGEMITGEEAGKRITSVISPTIQSVALFGLPGTGMSIYSDLRQVQAADQTRAAYEAMGQAIEASKVRQRIPEAHTELLNEVLKDSPLESVYIPAQSFTTYFQEQNIDPRQAAVELGIEEYYDAALELDGDIKIPFSAWTGTVIGTPHWKGLAEDVKFQPDDLTPRQAKERMAEIEEAVAEEATRVEVRADELMARDDTAKYWHGQIYDFVKTALEGNAAFGADMKPAERKSVIDKNAKVFAAHYVAEAARRGVSVEELWTGQRIQIGDMMAPADSRFAGMTEEQLTGRMDEIDAEVARLNDQIRMEAEDEILAQYIRNEINQGEAGMRVASEARNQTRGAMETRWMGIGSTFPEWFKGKGYTRKAVLKILDKVLAGKTLTDKQRATYEELKAGAREAMQQAAEFRNAEIERIKAEQGLTDADVTALAAESDAGENAVYALPDGREIPAAVKQDIDFAMGMLPGNTADMAARHVPLQERIRTLTGEVESIQRYMSGPLQQAVQQVSGPRLVTVHNLSESKLINADKMGGLAVPSIGITGDEAPMTGFGEISLVADPSLIDPKAAASNKVFDADIYSPRYPKVEYSIDAKAHKRLLQAVDIGVKELPFSLSSDLSEDSIQSKGMKALEYSVLLQAAFLKSKGVDVPVAYESRDLGYIEAAPEFLDIVGKYDTVAEIIEKPGFKEAYRKAVDSFKKANDMDGDGSFYNEDGTPNIYIVRDIKRQVNEYGSDPNVDAYAFEDAVRSAMEGLADEYAAWVQENFADLITEEKIFQGYTNSGRRRYSAHTLENVVREIKKGLRDGEGGSYGAGQVRSVVAKQFRSLKQIKDSRGRLVDEKTMQAFKDETNSELSELASRLAKLNSYSDNSLIAMDIAIEHIKEIATRGVRAVANDYYGGQIPEELLSKISDFLDKLRNAPTEYFEAKLQRAVGINEFKAAIVPDDVSEKALSILKKNGITEIVTYKHGDEQSRVEAFSKLREADPDLFFQGALSPVQLFQSPSGGIIDPMQTPEGAGDISTGKTPDQPAGGNLQNVPEELRPLYEEARKYNTAEEFVESRKYQGGTYILSEGKDIEVYDAYENQYRSIEDINDKIWQLRRERDRAYDPDIYDSQEESDKDIDDEIGDLESLKEVVYQKIEKASFDAIEEWLSKNKSWLGDNYEYVFDLIYGNKETGGTAWERLVETEDGEEAISMIKRMDVASQRHRTTNYDAIDKKGMTDEQVSDLRSSINKDLALGGIEAQDTQYLTDIWNRAHESSRPASDAGLFQGGSAPRGSVQFTPDSTIISLFKNADASTFLHESAHVWLEDSFRYVKAGMADERYMADYSVLAQWLGIADDQERITREQHEQFARGFEAYLMEGQAPSYGLRKVFASVRRWLVRIYRTVASLNVQLTDEVRRVMDRMLATDDEIAYAQEAAGRAIDIDLTGYPQEVLDRIETLRTRAHEEATATLLKEQMAELKSEQRELVEKERARVTEEVTKSVPEMARFAARSAVLGAYPGKTIDELAAAYQADTLSENDISRLDVIAQIHGFGGFDQLVQDLAGSPTMEEEIAALIKQRMAPYQDMMKTQAVKEKAMQAIHNERSLELLALETALLKEKAMQAAQSEAQRVFNRKRAQFDARAARVKARQMLSMSSIREAVNFGPYVTAERRAAADVAKYMAKGQEGKAAEAKARQMYNHALALESMELRKRYEKALKQIDRLMKRDKDRFHDDDSFAQAAALLDRFGFGMRQDYDPMWPKSTLREWAEKMDASFGGTEGSGLLELPEWILDETGRTDYRKLSVSEFSEVYNAIRNVVHVANAVDRAFALADRQSISELAVELSNQLDAVIRKDYAPGVETGFMDDMTQFQQKYGFSLERIDQFVQKADGGRDSGLFRDVFVTPIKEAADKESARRAQATERLKEIWSAYSKDERRQIFKREKFIPEFGARMTKQRLLAMALNLGNDTNRNRIFETAPVGFSPIIPWNSRDPLYDRRLVEETVMGVLRRELDERDWKWVQDIWDMLESYYPDISKMHADLTGFEPGKVDPVPFDVLLADGRMLTMKGGYYPLKEDYRATERAAIREISQEPLYTEGNPAWKATTKTGHTKSRVNAKYAVSLDLGLISRHLNDIIHDLYFRPIVYDFRRIAARPEFESGVKQRMGEQGFRYMQNYIASVATGGNAVKLATDAVSAAARWLNERVVAAVAMGRVSIIVQNFANPFLAVGRVEGFGPRDAARAVLGRGLADYWVKSALNWKAAQEMRDFVWSKSRFMLDKHENPEYTIRDFKGVAMQDPNVSEFFLGMIAGTDDLTNIPMWLEAYHKKLTETDSEQQAIDYADMLINRMTGSGRKYDQAPIIRGSDLERLVSKLYSFFSVEYNNWLQEVRVAQREGIRSAPRLMGFVASRLMFLYLSAALAGQLPDDDDEDKAKRYAAVLLSYPTAFFPGIREFAQVTINQVLDLPTFGYRPAPLVSLIEAGGEVAGDIGNLIAGDDVALDLFEDASRLAAYGFQYPDQFNSWFWNAYDYMANGMDPAFEDIYRRRRKKDR